MTKISKNLNFINHLFQLRLSFKQKTIEHIKKENNRKCNQQQITSQQQQSAWNN